MPARALAQIRAIEVIERFDERNDVRGCGEEEQGCDGGGS